MWVNLGPSSTMSYNFWYPFWDIFPTFGECRKRETVVKCSSTIKVQVELQGKAGSKNHSHSHLQPSITTAWRSNSPLSLFKLSSLLLLQLSMAFPLTTITLGVLWCAVTVTATGIVCSFYHTWKKNILNPPPSDCVATLAPSIAACYKAGFKESAGTCWPLLIVLCSLIGLPTDIFDDISCGAAISNDVVNVVSEFCSP